MLGKILIVISVLALVCLTFALGSIAIDLHHYVTQSGNGFTAPWVNTIVRGPVQ
jgi:hypothetical protein